MTATVQPAAADTRTPWGRAAARERVALTLLARRAPVATGAGVALALLRVVADRPDTLAPVAMWIGALVLAALVECGLDGRAARRSWLLCAAVTGFAWGGAGTWLWPPGGPEQAGVWLALTLAFALLGALARAASAAVATAFALACMVPPLLALALAPWAGAGTLALAGTAALALAVGAARRLASDQAARLAAEQEVAELEGVAQALNRALEDAVRSDGEPDPASIAAIARVLYDEGEDAMLIVGPQGHVRSANRVARAGRFGPDPVGLEMGRALALVDCATRRAFPDPAAQVRASGAPVRLFGDRTLCVHPKGHDLNVDLHAVALAGGDVLVRVTDTTEARGLAELMDYHATHDPLTGLPNRAELERCLEAESLRARESGRPGALLYVDLEGLDPINDACGHRAGDEVLAAVAERLLGELATTAHLLARISGSRFGVLLSDVRAESALALAERMRRALSDLHFPWGDNAFPVTASVGITSVGEAHDAPAPLARAAVASQVARAAGGNRVLPYAADDDAVSARQELGHWLRGVHDAVAEDRLRLAGQPIVPIVADGPLRPHLEVLVRVVDRLGTLNAPRSFIAAAEYLHAMPGVDRVVAGRVIDLLARDAPSLRDFETCAVNLSGQSVSDPDFPDFLIGHLERTGVDPARLQFEITETAVVLDLEAAARCIERLRALGCRFAIDDFGTGHSSYGYLRKLRVDYLKIDGSFVRGIHEDPADRAVVESINRVGHALGMKTVAEHVITEEHLSTLRRIGVDFAQGAAVGAPRPIE